MKQAAGGSKKTARCIRSPVKYHAWQFPHCVSVRLGFSLHLQQQSLRLQRQGNKASRRTSGQHDTLASTWPCCGDRVFAGFRSLAAVKRAVEMKIAFQNVDDRYTPAHRYGFTFSHAGTSRFFKTICFKQSLISSGQYTLTQRTRSLVDDGAAMAGEAYEATDALEALLEAGGSLGCSLAGSTSTGGSSTTISSAAGGAVEASCSNSILPCANCEQRNCERVSPPLDRQRIALSNPG